MPTQATIAAEAAGFVKKTPANGTISLIYGNISGGYPIVNYEYAIVSTHQSSSVRRRRTSVRCSSGRSTRSTATAPRYLSQVNFQPLPSKVEAQSLKQILSIH